MTVHKEKAAACFSGSRMGILPLLLATLLLPSCAARESGTRGLTPPENAENNARAEQIWQLFRARAGTAEALTGPFRISANLRYSDAEGKNTRVSSLLWGNGKADSPLPLRLDLLAGIGSVAAKVREDEKSFTAFVPEEKTAYVHDGGARTLASFGVPIPLSLSELSLLLTGRCGSLFLPASPDGDFAVPPAHGLTSDGARYIVPDAPMPGVLELSDAGVPLSWTELRDNGWTILFEPEEANPLQPKILRISHPKGYSALVVVKARTRVSPPYTTAGMDLPLPPGTTMKTLEK